MSANPFDSSEFTGILPLQRAVILNCELLRARVTARIRIVANNNFSVFALNKAFEDHFHVLMSKNARTRTSVKTVPIATPIAGDRPLLANANPKTIDNATLTIVPISIAIR